MPRAIRHSYAQYSYLSFMADLLSRIIVNPTICHGQPTVRGLRYPVRNVLELLASGMAEAEILADYKDLEAEDLRACQAYAAELLKTKTFYRLAS